MAGEKLELYAVDFDVYGVDFEVFQDTPYDPTVNQVDPDELSEVSVHISEQSSSPLVFQPEEVSSPRQLEPDLNELEQDLVDYLRLSSGRTHIGRIVRGCFGVNRLNRSAFSELIQTLDILERKGYVNRHKEGQYYGAPEEPQKFCICFDCRNCSDTLNEETQTHIAICFAGKLAMRAEEMISGQESAGIKWTEIARDFSEQLSMTDVEPARQLVRDLEREGHLYRSGDYKGTRLLTTDPQFKAESTPRESVKRRTEAVVGWSEDIIVAASLLLDQLAEVQQFQQGATPRWLHENVKESIEITERMCKQILRLLEKETLVVIGANGEKHAKRSASNANRVTFVDSATRLRWKNDRETIIKELKQLIQAPIDQLIE